LRIGIDLLGSDTPPADLFPAIVQVSQQAPSQVSMVIFATEAVIQEICPGTPPHGIEFHPVANFIAMTDDPLLAIRQKKESSLVTGMRLLKKKRISALISAGNTGALIAAAALMLPKMPGIQRPGLLAVLPTLHAPLTVLDVGGNVASRADHLLQFAHLGAAYSLCSTRKRKSRIGLLNIGTESKKGRAEIRQAYHLLAESFTAEKTPAIEFIGNVEAKDIFKGHFDVLVTDGFTGNVLLKTSEGVSRFIFDRLNISATPSLKHSARELEKTFDHAEYPGALVCGVEGLVIKCHGNATSTALYHAIIGAASLINRRLIPKMKASLS
jgi:glycerol-3-phosphate acyltransferase PlsX